MVHMRRGDVWRKALAVRISVRQYFADRIPVASEQASRTSQRRIADAFEDVEKLLIAVDMAFRNLPIVRAGISRLARVADDDAVFESLCVDIKGLAEHALGPEMDASDTAVLGRVVILKSGRAP